MDDEKKTSLPTRNVSTDTQVNALFQRFATRYGSRFLDMWSSVPIEAVKDEWAFALRRYYPVQIRQALEWCGKFPPTLPEFLALCEQAPRPTVAPAPAMRIVHDKKGVPMPEHIRRNIDALLKRTPAPARQMSREQQIVKASEGE